MATKAHSLVSLAAKHPIHKWEHANAAARAGETVAATDLGAVSWQQDNNTFWVALTTGPTWAQLVTAGSGYFTPGSVVFAGSSGELTQDNTNLFWDDSTDRLGVGINTPTYRLSIGSPTNTDQVGIFHDDSNAFFRTTDGSFVFQTDEVGQPTFVDIKGNGGGIGYLRAFNATGSATWVEFFCVNTEGYVSVGGTSTAFNIEAGANIDIKCFAAAADGETRELKITGYRSGDASRDLEIGVGVDADDTASFDGVGNYWFDGTVNNTGGRINNITTVAAATYDLLSTDNILHVTYTGTGAVTSLTLPTAQTVAGRTIHIKDAGGNAATNTITIDTGGGETIDGASTYVLSTDYEAVSLYSDGSNWFAF